MSAPIFSFVAFVLCALVGDLKGGKKYGDIAIQYSSTDTAARVLLITAEMVMHYQIPFEKCIGMLLEGYEKGSVKGDFQSALGCMQCAIHLSIYDGKKPLEEILADCEKYASEMKLYEQQLILTNTQALWQLVQNMVDGSTCKLRGDHFDEAKDLALDYSEKHMVKRTMYRCKLVAAFWFDNQEEMLQIIEQRKYHKFSMDKADPGLAENTVAYLYMGILFVSMAIKQKGKSDEKKFKKLATQCLRKIRALAQKGDPNMQHAEALLDAELVGVYGNRYVAAAQYDVAILLGERSGFQNDTALAHERFADFLMRVDEPEKAREHYSRAFELFAQWGAKCRLNALRARVEHLLVNVQRIEVSCQDTTMVSALT